MGENEQWNIGVDFALFSWLNGTLEYYTRSSDGLLYYQELPLSAQVGNVTGINTNVGDIRNSGFEATLGFQLFNQNKFQWRIDVNMSTLKMKLLSFQQKLVFGQMLLLGTSLKREDHYMILGTEICWC